MSKITFEPKTGNVTIEFDADKETDIFEKLSGFQEVFGEISCPVEGSKQRFRYMVREAGKYKFYELRCLDTGYKLAFGQSDGGKLFPKRWMDKSTGPAPYWQPFGKDGKDKNKVYDNKYQGWHKYHKDKTKDAE